MGLFNETLPGLAKEWAADSRIAFMHVDSDLYASAADVFKNTHQFLRTNSFIVFDELVNYPGYQDHELKAFYEFLVPLNAAKRLQADSMRQLKTLFYSSEPQFKHTS